MPPALKPTRPRLVAQRHRCDGCGKIIPQGEVEVCVRNPAIKERSGWQTFCKGCYPKEAK